MEREGEEDQYKDGWTCVMLSCLSHSRFRRLKRLACAFVGFAPSSFVVKYCDRSTRAEFRGSSVGAKSVLCVVC